MNVNANELCDCAEFRRQVGEAFLSCRVIMYLMLEAANQLLFKSFGEGICHIH